ncbi:FAD/NAD(P)-binding domain-containing protein [Aspergillus steynii IBT 23096]|uniref:FAD/NAD(P)-binding domain-containing protein n=1 Tax=Aspergillus steynii IBT 23096 TaxID=1392250 RepID=A0A2I2G905_9EURO|nr:FAD/NAD(P)-binding domain-containing protein [Aspergillus steynii IBT 23096]PLB49367.1 FAD/NAD(P)-binding domain-containing protein [Aspergillus steynii IBT 23096]
MEEDILIVGAGIFGVSTAYHLALHASNPSRITLLDRAAAPSSVAASTDINKIIRADYSNPLYMDLGFEAIEAWKNLPFFRDAGVYHQSGWIAMDEKHSDVPTRIRENFRASGREDVIEDLTEEEVRRRWSVLAQTDCAPFGSYYYNPSAGWADAGKALQVMAQETVKLGVNYQVGEARRVVWGDGRVEGVGTEMGRVFRADKVLLATGAWTSQLMSSVEDELGLLEAERVESQISATGVSVAHFQLSEAEKEVYSQLPVFVYGGLGEVIPPTESGVLKFTFSTSFKNTVQTPSGHKISVPSIQSQWEVPKKLQESSIPQIRARIPQILENDRRPDYYRLCWDSISSDQHPRITRHPDSKLSNLYLAVGGSFHCYKFLPTIGKYVVNVLNGVTNGAQQDEAWVWKQSQRSERGVHESLVPKNELQDFS